MSVDTPEREIVYYRGSTFPVGWVLLGVVAAVALAIVIARGNSLVEYGFAVVLTGIWWVYLWYAPSIFAGMVLSYVARRGDELIVQPMHYFREEKRISIPLADIEGWNWTRINLGVEALKVAAELLLPGRQYYSKQRYIYFTVGGERFSIPFTASSNIDFDKLRELVPQVVDGIRGERR